MRGVARIRFADGVVVLPSRSPYDREAVLETVRHCAYRHTAVQLELDGRRWRLTRPLAAQPADCARCLRAARLYGIDDARVVGAVCAACLAVVLSLTATSADATLNDPVAEAAPPRGAAPVPPSHAARATRAEETQP